MKKYAIVGASGLIGSHLTKKLINSSCVYAFSRSSLGFEHPHLICISCDLQTESLVNKIPNDTDTIIYLAQSEYFRDFPDKTIETFNVNVQRYLEILQYASTHNIKHVIYASSGGIYEQKNKHFNEEDRLALSGELGFYLGSKICSELVSSAFSRLLNIQVLRFFFVYGPKQKENMLIPRLIKNIKEGTPISLEGEEGLIINPLHVSDAVSAIQMLLNIQNSEIYNIAGGEYHSLRQICTIIGNILGIEPIFQIKNAPEKKICGNISKMQKIGWSPRVNFTEGIKSILNVI